VKGLLSTRSVFLTVIAVGLFGMAVRNVLDPDVWWHLKTGEYIVAHGAVPHADPFSYTRAGEPWVAHEWLTELLMYGLLRAGGWQALSVVFAAVICASFLLLLLRCRGSLHFAGALAVWGAWATTPVWGVRPQMLSLLLTSLWLLILERSERNRQLLWWTLPLTLLWVNSHAGFALGLTLLVLFFAGELLERLSGSSPAASDYARLRMLAIVFFFDLLLVPLNPNGARMYSYPIQTLRSNAMQTYISEWQSPNFHRADHWPFLFLLLATIVTLAWSRARLRWRDLLLLLAGTFAALSSIRMVPLFVLIAVPLLAKAAVVWHSDRAPSRSQPPRLIFNAAILLLLAGFVSVHIAQVFRQQSQAEAEHFPAQAAAFLAAHPGPGPLFNHYDWGGYLIWKLYPGARVFVDGRADVYGDVFLQQVMKTYQLNGDWQKELTRWEVGAVIVPPESALASGLRIHPDWTHQYEDSKAVVFFSRRNSGTFASPSSRGH
jgi:hypothetical protein